MGLLNTKLMQIRDRDRNKHGIHSLQFRQSQHDVECSQNECIHDLTKDIKVKAFGFWVDPGDVLVECLLCSAAVSVNGVPFKQVTRKRG